MLLVPDPHSQNTDPDPGEQNQGGSLFKFFLCFFKEVLLSEHLQYSEAANLGSCEGEEYHPDPVLMSP